MTMQINETLKASTTFSTVFPDTYFIKSQKSEKLGKKIKKKGKLFFFFKSLQGKLLWKKKIADIQKTET